VTRERMSAALPVTIIGHAPRRAAAHARTASEHRSRTERGRHRGRADTLVEGSVQSQGGRVRVNARLLRAATGTIAWSGVFQGPEDLPRRRFLAMTLTALGSAALSGCRVAPAAPPSSRVPRLSARVRPPTRSVEPGLT